MDDHSKLHSLVVVMVRMSSFTKISWVLRVAPRGYITSNSLADLVAMTPNMDFTTDGEGITERIVDVFRGFIRHRSTTV